MGATSQELCGGGFVRKGRGVLPDGTEVATGEVMVRAGGGRNFVASAWTQNGIDDAEKVRCKREGSAAPLTHAKKQEIAALRNKQRIEAERAKMDGAMPGGQTVVTQAPLTGLAAQLQGFEDDPEMQKVILDRWNKKRAEAAKAAEKAKTPEPAQA